MDRKNKKRVARIVQSGSKRNRNEMNDMVAEIINNMNTGLADSKFYNILKSPSSEGSSGQNSNGMSSTIPTQPSVAPQQQKKFLPAKRHHPLMKKAEKSRNYIKHNLSIPKPRAHVGGLSDIVQITRDKIGSKRSLSSSHVEKKQKSTSVSAKNWQNKSDYLTNNTLSDENVSDVSSEVRKLPVLSSDSESEFESFIQAQKHDIDWDEQNSGKSSRKKRKQKKNCTKGKTVKSKKDKQLKSVGKSKISTIATATNRIQLPLTSESSTSSADENELRGTRKVSSIPLFENNKIEPHKQIDTNRLMCSVSLERIPHLDETATLLNPSSKDNDNENNECSPRLQGSETIAFTACKDEATLHSDDECMIVYEVPNCSDHNIQISDVVSLGEGQRVSDTNDGNSDGLDLEESKEPIEISKKSPSLQNSELNNSNLEPNDLNNILNKIDFEQILSVVSLGEGQKVTDRNDGHSYGVGFAVSQEQIENSKKLDFSFPQNFSNNKSLSDEKVVDFLPCSSSFTVDDQPSFGNLPSINPEIIPEVHWLNLKKAVSLNNCYQNELPVTSELLRGNIESIDSVKTNVGKSSAIITDCNLSASDLKEIISKCTENTFQSKNTIKLQSKKDCYEDVCDELDILGAESIQDLCRNQNSLDISRLLHVYKEKVQEYNEIKNSEKTLTYSLQLLKESLLAKKDNIEVALEHLMKHDPCFLTTQSNSKSLIEMQEREASLKQVKRCVNCESQATIICDLCKVVYFCTNECGVLYWERGHYKTCTGMQKSEELDVK